MTWRRPPEPDDRGTSLILALVFVFVIGMVLVAVGGLAANALLNTSNARVGRTLTGDAEAAVTIAMQYVRYIPAPTSTPPSCLPPTSAIPSSDPRVNTVSPVQVDCSWVVNTASPQSRVVDFYACPSSVSSLSTCQSSALLHAQVAYNDLDSEGNDNCYNGGSFIVTTSCGRGMNINLWDVIGADN